jgi:hypothetical protein
MKYPHFANITFLGKVGETLRQAIGDTVTSDLPENIRLLLRRLERTERRQDLSRLTANNDRSATAASGESSHHDNMATADRNGGSHR